MQKIFNFRLIFLNRLTVTYTCTAKVASLRVPDERSRLHTAPATIQNIATCCLVSNQSNSLADSLKPLSLRYTTNDRVDQE